MACRLALVGGVALGVPAAAQEYATRDVGDWTVAASKDGKGCFLTKEYKARETTVLLGLDLDNSNRLSLLNPNWSIKAKERLKLNFRLSNSSFPNRFAVGLAANGKRGFATSFGEKFPTLFAASRFLNISRGDVPVEELSLAGSGAAVAELRKCVAAQRAHRPAAEEPQDLGDHIPVDPFAVEARGKR